MKVEFKDAFIKTFRKLFFKQDPVLKAFLLCYNIL